jgi:hypothetical protein
MYKMTIAQIYEKEAIMHQDFARESLISQVGQGVPEINIVKLLLIDQVLTLALNCDDGKIKAIAANMKEAEGSKFKRVTDSQKNVVAQYLLQQYKTAKDVIAAAYGQSRSDFWGTDPTHDGLVISTVYVFRHDELYQESGLVTLGTFAGKRHHDYPITEAAVAECLTVAHITPFPDTVCGADLPGVGRAKLTVQEREKLGLPECYWHLNGTPAAQPA